MATISQSLEATFENIRNSSVPISGWGDQDIDTIAENVSIYRFSVPRTSGWRDPETKEFLTSKGHIVNYMQLRTRLEADGWFKKPELFKNIFGEFVDKFLKPECAKKSYKWATMRFERLLNLVERFGTDWFMTESPRQPEDPMSLKEYWQTRTTLRLLEANQLCEGGLFANHDCSEGRLSLDCRKVWQILLKERDIWLNRFYHDRPVPAKPAKRKFSSFLEKVEGPSTFSKASMKSMSSTGCGGRLIITWAPKKPQIPCVVAIDEIGRKSWNVMLVEATKRLKLTRLDQTQILLSETLQSILDRCPKSAEEASVADLLDDKEQMRACDWEKIQRRAMATDEPLFAIIRPVPPKREISSAYAVPTVETTASPGAELPSIYSSDDHNSEQMSSVTTPSEAPSCPPNTSPYVEASSSPCVGGTQLDASQPATDLEAPSNALQTPFWFPPGSFCRSSYSLL